ncbi:DUF4328 domain-containing protein [Embleya sp. MST-111070]|uniref:DUF4328 domain-containing protein n=1 Tax=Embleya sp. MST-111070 TaxID=3398231 RepID=UPI003F74088F
MMGISALVSAFAVVTLVYRAGLWDDIAHGRRPAREPNEFNDNLALFWQPYTFVQLALMAVFLIWFHRARRNIDTYPGRPRRMLSSGWAIGGWFCPVVNLWFPPRITVDVWRASDPRTQHGGGLTRGALVLVWGWWITFVAAMTIALGVRYLGPDADPEISSLLVDTVADAEAARTVSLVKAGLFIVQIVATALAVAVIAHITTLQNKREATLPAPTFAAPPPTFAPYAAEHATAGPPAHTAPAQAWVTPNGS